MKKLPDIHIIPAPESQRERLTRWIAEWETDRALEDENDAAATLLKDQSDISDMDEPLRAGQIRLLCPEDRVRQTRLRYIAVLQELENDLCLVAPFSRFNEPATPGELKTTRDQFLLRVLCLWNARELPEATARRSWVIDELPKGELADARDLHAALLSGGAPPERLSDRIGPPIVHPLDPRNDYMEEERRWMAELASVTSAKNPILFPIPQTELRKAAEDRAEYKAKKEEPPENPE